MILSVSIPERLCRAIQAVCDEEQIPFSRAVTKGLGMWLTAYLSTEDLTMPPDNNDDPPFIS